MNKKEAINRVFMEREYDESIGLYIDYDTVKKIIEQIEEPLDWEKTEWEAVEELDKVKIPRFVADWVEENRDSYSEKHKLISRFLSSVKHSVKTQDCYQWSKTEGNMDKFMEALVNGYEIEKEPLFYAKVKGHELLRDKDNMYWNYAEDDCELGILDNSEIGSYKTKFTRQQWNNLGINDANADFEGVE